MNEIRGCTNIGEVPLLLRASVRPSPKVLLSEIYATGGGIATGGNTGTQRPHSILRRQRDCYNSFSIPDLRSLKGLSLLGDWSVRPYTALASLV